MQNHPSWWQLRRQTIHNSPHLRVHLDDVQLPNGQVVNEYSVVELNDPIMVVATDTSGQIIMLQEYRYAVDQTMWNMPAGTIVKGAEDPCTAALRELHEETGYSAPKAVKVAELHEYPTKATHTVHVIRVANAQKTGDPHRGATEQIRVKLLSPAELKQLVFSGAVKTTSVIASLVLALPELFGGAKMDDL